MNTTTQNESVLESLCEVALEISARRAQTLAALRAALEEGDERGALSLAKELVGLSDDLNSRQALGLPKAR
jgi:hypothetical protein